MTRADRLRKVAQKQRTPPDERQSRLSAAALGRTGDPGAAAFVALKYFQHRYECFSEWTPDELHAFSDFNRKVSSQTWQQIIASGGKGPNKAGLGYTPHDGSRLPSREVLRGLSEDLTWIELRVTQRARVHGFRAENIFFLVFLDRSHRYLH